MDGTIGSGEELSSQLEAVGTASKGHQTPPLIAEEAGGAPEGGSSPFLLVCAEPSEDVVLERGSPGLHQCERAVSVFA